MTEPEHRATAPDDADGAPTRSVNDPKQNTHFDVIPKPELFIGLVGAVGSDLTLLSAALTEELEKVGYKATIIQLSKNLKQLPQYKNIPESPKDVRYHAYMTAGNGFREDTRRGDAMALLGIASMREHRKTVTESESTPDNDGRAYIIRSLKHPEEVETLRRG